MKNELVTVIIPCYNAEKFIENTLKTVLHQTYENFELIVVDDGSKDNSAKIVKQIAQNDNRIIYIYQSNGGVSSARNKGIRASKGAYISFLDSDDLWNKDNLEKKIQVIKNNERIDWVYCDIDLVDIDGRIINTLYGNDINIFEGLLIMKETIVPGISSNIFCKKTCFANDSLNFDEKLSTSADLDFAIQLAHKHKGQRIKEVLVQCLKYGGNMSENVKLYEKDMIYLLNKNLEQKLYPSDNIYKQNISNFYQSMFISYRKSDKKKAFNYLGKMIKARPFSLVSLVIKTIKSLKNF